MGQETLLNHLFDALACISAPRYYKSERGFQGALLGELAKRIPEGLLDGAIIEQEYQKRLLHHGVTIRPDVIVHEPFDERRHESRSEANLLVMELKLMADEKRAVADLESLTAMIDVLAYKAAAFINIGSDETFQHLIPENYRERIVCFAVDLVDGKARVARSEFGPTGP
jgi:hypothetical protein